MLVNVALTMRCVKHATNGLSLTIIPLMLRFQRSKRLFGDIYTQTKQLISHLTNSKVERNSCWEERVNFILE